MFQQSEKIDFTFLVIEKTLCSVTVDVEVLGAIVLDEVKFAFSQIRSKVKVNGFRRSMAPASIVEKKFFYEAKNKAVESVINKTVFDALEKEKIVPIGFPLIEDFNYEFGQILKYRFTAEYHPVVKVRNYKGIPIIKKIFRITDENLNDALGILRNRSAKLIPSKLGEATEKSFVYVDYTAFDSTGEIIPEFTAKNHIIDLGFDGTAVGFRDALKASKIGDRKDVEVEYPVDYPNRIFAGKKITFKMKVVEIKEKELLELNDDFAKNMRAESLEDLKLKLKKTMDGEEKLRQNADVEKQIVDYLLEKNIFEVPRSLVKSQIETLTKRMEKYMKMHGVSRKHIEKQVELGQENLKKEAERDIRLFYILNAIQASESLAVVDCGIDTEKNKMKPLISNENITVDKYFSGKKIIEFLLDNACIKVEEKNMPLKKFD
jgi:trigger factor